METELLQKLSTGDLLSQAGALCKEALMAPEFMGWTNTPARYPTDAKEWFRLLSGYPYTPANTARIKALKDSWPSAAARAGATFERCAILQSLSAAAELIRPLPLADSVKRLFAQLCRQVSASDARWANHYCEDLIDAKTATFSAKGKLFRDLAWLACLRRFPAGDYVFDAHPVVARSTLLKIPPRAIPGFLREIGQGMGGWGPTLSPHTNSGRANQLILQKTEFERSLWRMARTLEKNPNIKGLESHSWLLSAELAGRSPHLAWMRNIYLDAGAYAVDMDPAPEDAGFQIGSARRRRLHQEGEFHPRETLILWRRADMLRWAADRPDLADPGEEPPRAPAQPRRTVRIPSPPPCRPSRRNSSITLWGGGSRMLNRHPKIYVALVILLPAFLAAMAAASVTWLAAVPAFTTALVGAWLFQYYFFQ